MGLSSAWFCSTSVIDCALLFFAVVAIESSTGGAFKRHSHDSFTFKNNTNTITMTRTHDSSDAPRYVNRDRHLNRSGVDGDLKKGGQGAHNWGNSELDPEYINDQQAKEIGEEDNLMEQEKKAPTGPTTINLGDLPVCLASKFRVKAHDADQAGKEEARTIHRALFNHGIHRRICFQLGHVNS